MSIFSSIFSNIYKQVTYYYVCRLEKTTNNDLGLKWNCNSFVNENEAQNFKNNNNGDNFVYEKSFTSEQTSLFNIKFNNLSPNQLNDIAVELFEHESSPNVSSVDSSELTATSTASPALVQTASNSQVTNTVDLVELDSSSNVSSVVSLTSTSINEQVQVLEVLEEKQDKVSNDINAGSVETESLQNLD